MPDKPEPVWNNVYSSCVRRTKYDEDKQELSVEYKNGRIYVYGGVEPDIGRDLHRSASIGQALDQWVKPNYGATRVK